MEDPTKIIVNYARVVMSKFAVSLDKVFKGKLKPAHITTLSLLGHFPAAWALWTGKPVLAAVLLAAFGLLDALDGALARAQETASKSGMFYDAVTDRIKEIIIYAGLAVYLANSGLEAGSWLVVAVAGSSILVSYVKAKGEMAVTSKNHDKQALNRAFGIGISRYEIRMALLVAGLLVTDLLTPLLRLMLALNLLTAAIRFLEISKILNQEDQKEQVERKNAKDRSTHA